MNTYHRSIRIYNHYNPTFLTSLVLSSHLEFSTIILKLNLKRAPEISKLLGLQWLQYDRFESQFYSKYRFRLAYIMDSINIAHFLFFKHQIMQNEWYMVQNNHLFLVDWIVLVEKLYSLELCIHWAKFSIWSTVTVFSFIYEYIGYSQIHLKIQFEIVLRLLL